jgi:hypothetical protein
LDEIEYHTDDLSVVPLGQVSELYFKWKMANNSLLTLARERRMFKNVLKFFGAQRPVLSVKIASPPRRPGRSLHTVRIGEYGRTHRRDFTFDLYMAIAWQSKDSLLREHGKV